jgi:hypothetical protein
MLGRALVASLGAALLLSACGAGPSTTASTTQAPEPLPAVGLRIDAPEGGSVVADDDAGTLTGDVVVRGHAQPGAYVRVSSGCQNQDCDLSAQVSDDGSWTVSVEAQASASKPYARIYAQLAAESAITLVKLRAPATKAERDTARQTRKARAKRAQREQSTSAPTTGELPTPDLPTIPNATPTPTPSPTPGTGGGGTSVLLIGDSLGVGIQPYLSGLLTGWSVTSDSRVGRPLAEGMERWRAEKGSAEVSAFSLFTNDAPTNTSALESAVRESAANGCAVWATIVRPAQGGTSYAKANQVLEGLAQQLPGRVVLVPWAATVAADPSLVGSDGVHATPTGYRERAQLYAQAIQQCG